jgi:hypothetical protein
LSYTLLNELALQQASSSSTCSTSTQKQQHQQQQQPWTPVGVRERLVARLCADHERLFGAVRRLLVLVVVDDNNNDGVGEAQWWLWWWSLLVNWGQPSGDFTPATLAFVKSQCEGRLGRTL